MAGKTPLELIKEGILSGSWKQVVSGYGKLTGEKLKVPDVILPENDIEFIKKVAYEQAIRHIVDQISQLNPLSVIEIPQQDTSPALSDEEDKIEKDKIEQKNVIPFNRNRVDPNQFKVDHGKRSKTVAHRPPTEPNRFETEGFKDLARNESQFDKKVMSNLRPSPRRPESNTKMVQMECRACNGIFEVIPEEASRSLGANEESTWCCTGCLKKNNPR